jgi:2-methylcitrate dehydratase PrpD
MSTTEKLAKFVIESQFDSYPEEASSQIKKSMLDGIGTCLESTIRPIGRIISEFTEELGGNTDARLLGSGIETSVVNAAFANGVLTHGADYDDSGKGFGHTACVLMPTVLALGEKYKLSGKTIMDAFTVGFEVGSKVGLNIGTDHYEKGWHKTSTMGALGGAAAASRLLDLSVEETRTALGIATSTASGVRANFGYMTKPYHPGNSARGGIVSAMLAKKGFSANPSAIEGRHGYFAVFGDQQANLDGVTENLGNPLAISNAIRIKPWPCCAGTHAALTCLEEITAETKINADDIAEIKVYISQEPLEIAPNMWNPQSGFNGKFSLWYVIAAYLLDSKLDINSFSDRKVLRSKVQDLIGRIDIKQHNDFIHLPPRAIESSRFNEISIKMNDGTVLSHRVEIGRHLQGEDVKVKFRDNARLAGLSKSQIERLIGLIDNLEEVEDVRSIVDASIANVATGID